MNTPRTQKRFNITIPDDLLDDEDSIEYEPIITQPSQTKSIKSRPAKKITKEPNTWEQDKVLIKDLKTELTRMGNQLKDYWRQGEDNAILKQLHSMNERDQEIFLILYKNQVYERLQRESTKDELLKELQKQITTLTDSNLALRQALSMNKLQMKTYNRIYKGHKKERKYNEFIKKNDTI